MGVELTGTPSGALLGLAGFDSRRSATGTFATINTTSYAAVDSAALDLLVGRFDGSSVAVGDILMVGLSYLASNSASFMRVDAQTLVSGSPVNYISGVGSAGLGVQAWAALTASLYIGVGAAVPYVVQAGDISDGQVNIRLVAKVDSGSRLFNRSTTTPIHFYASLIRPA